MAARCPRWIAPIVCLWAPAAAAQSEPNAIAFHHLVAPSYPAGADLVLEGRMQGAGDVERAEVWFRPLRVPGEPAPPEQPRPEGPGTEQPVDTDIWNAAELELLNETEYRAVIPAEHARAPG